METIMKQISQEKVTAHVDILVTSLVENRGLTGLDLNIESFMLDYVDNHPPADELTTNIYTLMDCLWTGDSSQTEDVLRYFLGRGGGSTPAGDDHVIGLLALHAITNAWHPAFVKTVMKLTEQEAITTPISHYYISNALNGTFLNVIARVMREMIEGQGDMLKKQILYLLPIGHTSGIDTSFGMLIGMLAMLRQQKRQPE